MARRMGPSTPLAKSLPSAIKACREAARSGYRNARQYLDEMEAVINQTSQQLNQKRTTLAQKRVDTSDVVRELQAQLREVVDRSHHLRTDCRTSLEARSKEVNEFSIVLFGRTMAGKSTLMEILNNGNGSSIGKGAQRTTKDVRSYHWHGLKFTDVPGVAAFEGLEDEEVAFKAAANADLVLFLITDDAPQRSEAECLARIRLCGKPVLGICNVKVAVKDDDEPKLFRRLIGTAFEEERLWGIVNQFHELIDQFIPGYRPQFVWTHLRSRFLAQQEADRSRRRALEKVSRFDRVEREIVSTVVNRGVFLKVKSFIDFTVKPMLELSDILLDHSARNVNRGRVFSGKVRQTVAWRGDFFRRGIYHIDGKVSHKVEELRQLIPQFVEDNYERQDAGRRWSLEVERCGLKNASKH